MKKLFLLFIFYFLFFTGLSAQETFFKFLQGWRSRKIYEFNNSYVIASTDATVPYQNHLDFSEISLLGDSITNWQFEIDTAISTDIIYTNSFSSKINNYRYAVGYITGDAPYNFGFLSKFSDDLKNEIWTKILPIGNSPNLKVISVKNDTSLIIGSFNKNGNNLYTTFLEVDTLGNIRWQKDFDCSGDCHLSPFHILPTEDNGFIFTCYEDHVNGQPGVEDIQMAIIKTDSLGNQEWRHSWGGDTTKNMGSWVVPLDDGNFLYAWTDNYYTGWNSQLNMDMTIRFAKFDIDGNVIWFKSLENQIVEIDYKISQMQMMPDGNIIIAASSFIEGGLIKIDQEANLIWHRELMPPNLAYEDNTASSQYMKILGVTFISDGGFILAGEYFSSQGNMFEEVYQSAYAYKLDEYGCYTPGCQIHDAVEKKEQKVANGFSIYPNPANDFIVIASLVLNEVEGEAKQSQTKTIKIYDLTGKIVKQTSLRGTKQSIQIGDLEKGIYFVQIGTETQKLIIK